MNEAKKVSIGFKGDESLLKTVDHLISKFIFSTVRDPSGRRLSKGEIMSAMIYSFNNLDQEDLERMVKQGLEIGKIPYTIDESAKD